MLFITESIDAIYEFLESGGVVLNYIGLLIFVMWLLILERTGYMFFSYRRERNQLLPKHEQHLCGTSLGSYRTYQALGCQS